MAVIVSLNVRPRGYVRVTSNITVSTRFDSPTPKCATPSESVVVREGRGVRFMLVTASCRQYLSSSQHVPACLFMDPSVLFDAALCSSHTLTLAVAANGIGTTTATMASHNRLSLNRTTQSSCTLSTSYQSSPLSVRLSPSEQSVRPPSDRSPAHVVATLHPPALSYHRREALRQFQRAPSLTSQLHR